MSSMLKPPKTAQAARKQRSEVAEEAVTTAYVRTRTFVEDYRVALIATAVGIAVIFLGVLGFIFWQRAQANEAQERLGAILPVYEAGQYQAALEGTVDAQGLSEIADGFRRTPAGNLAAFYAGNALFQLQRYDEADSYFARYRGEAMLAASAAAGRGAAAEELGDHERAARHYETAARTYTTPAAASEYLLDAARNHEAAGNLGAARAAYEQILEQYPNAPAAGLASIYLARVDALAEADAAAPRR
jgi:TolA-binding protein